jgi:large subunit ribosomal protein L9
MKVILRETIESLGSVGDEVNVKKGYARNYLLPQKKAVLSNPANRVQIEREREKLEIRAAKDKEQAEIFAEKVAGTICTIAAKVSEEDKLYGSVGTRDIQARLQEQGLEVDRKGILLSEPIKTLGSYIIPIQLHPEVRPEITVHVIAEE